MIPRAESTDFVAESRLYEIERRLYMLYGSPRHHNLPDPLDELVFILIARQTQETKYLRTYNRLRKEYPSWEDVLDADFDDLVQLLQDAGLADTKAKHIQNVLTRIEEDIGQLSLSFLSQLSDENVERYLSSLPGVGRKTALCIMMYSLNRQVFPVDTHTWRICQRLGFAPIGVQVSDSRSREIERNIPPNLRYSLHVNLIAHGRTVCTAIAPSCSNCALSDLCPSAFAPPPPARRKFRVIKLDERTPQMEERA